MDSNNRTKESSQTAGRYLAELIRCSLHEEVPGRKPEGCTWEQLWQLAKWNHVESMTAPAIRRYQGEIPDEPGTAWKRTLDETVYRRVRFDMEREQILTALAERGIACLPLKGILVAGYYPNPGMRWMCDNDILYGYIDPDGVGGWRLRGGDTGEQEHWVQEARRELVSVMTDLGYEVESLESNHDSFQKKPFFNFEMHRRLVDSRCGLAGYFENPWKKAIQNAGSEFLCHFSDEDEYLFLVSHAWKHFSRSGCGIRTLADEYMVLKHKGKMDWDYIHRELALMGVAEFEGALRETAVNVFSRAGRPDKKDWDMVCYMLGCGAYGNLPNRIRMRIEEREGSWKSYMIERFWMKDEDWMKEFYPFFYRHKSLRAVLPVYRMLKGVCIHPGKLFREWQEVNKYRLKDKEQE
mgnify:FL=1